jgi:hypothetical protein
MTSRIDWWRLLGALLMTLSAALVVGAGLLLVWSLAPSVGLGWAQ